MGVEQYGLGFRVTLGIFYEVEARGVGTKGNACLLYTSDAADE